jgi:3-oxoacyl-[acyl-carrier-protein] synthase I
MRGGIAAFSELPYWDCESMPVIGAAIPDLDFSLEPAQRLEWKLRLAVKECLSSVQSATLQRVPVIICLAEAGRPGGIDHSFSEWLIERLRLKFHPRLCQAIHGGHTSAFEALNIARNILLSDGADGCIVCAVDSYINASSIYWLDRHNRLKRYGNMNGVIPGEAAAAVYLQLGGNSAPQAETEVIGIGFGHEPASILTDGTLQGRGLASAARDAFADAACGFHDLDFRLSDVTG